MFYSTIQSSKVQLWQTRLARIPRWGWIAIFVGVILPLVVLGISLLAVAIISGLIVLFAVTLAAAVIGTARRLLRRPQDDGRRNVRIVVRSARVIDP